MIDFKEISIKFGSPLYIMDTNKIKENVEKIENSISYPNFKIHYAMFCNDNKDVLNLIKNLGLSILCLNENEIKNALMLGFSKEQIQVTGGTFTTKQLKRLLEYQININLDSLKQLELLERVMPNSEIGIRIKIGDQKGVGEGIDVKNINKVLELINNSKLKIIGFQTYIGTNIYDEQIFLEAAKILLELSKQFPDLRYINLGGGFGIPYSSKDKEFSWNYFGKEISKLFLDFGKNIELKIEPGRSIVGNAGYFLTKVLELRNEDTLVVDSPYTLFPRPFIYNANHKVKVVGNDGNTKIFKVRGCSINSKDYLSSPEFEGDAAFLPEDVKEGDLLYFSDAGAYSFTMQMNFLNYDKAKMVLI